MVIKYSLASHRISNVHLYTSESFLFHRLGALNIRDNGFVGQDALLPLFLLCAELGFQFDLLLVDKGRLVQFNGLVNDLISLLPTFEPIDKYFLVLQFLIIFEETMDLLDEMLREFLNIVVMVDGLVVVGNCNDLVIELALVDHSHHSDHLGINKGEDLQLHAADDQDVQRVMVIAVGHWDEPVIGGVMDCAEQDPVQLYQTAFLVQLVLGLRASWDFDQGTDNLRGIFAWRDVMPRILR